MTATSADDAMNSSAPTQVSKPSQMADNDSRTCPMCGATIMAIALKCRFCGEALPPATRDVPSTPTLQAGRYEPRGFVALFVSFFPFMAGMYALFWTWGFAAVQNRSFAEIFPFGVAAGIFFGLVCGAIFAYIMRRNTQSLSVSDRTDFLARLDAAAGRIKYTLATQAGNALLYKPRFGAGVGAGIVIELREGDAVMTGPKAALSRLLKQMARDE